MKKNHDFIDSGGRSWQELAPIIKSRLQQLEGNPDVYWDCNGQPVWTKYKAMKNLSAGQPTHFYCFDKQWAAADWTTPTDVDVDQLMINRAREIRHNNDFVRLNYSGGSDSHTVLTSFKMAGVAPDEIIFWTKLWNAKSFFDSNFEVDRAIIPYISTIQEWFPNVKIRHLDLDFNGVLNALRLLHPDHAGFEVASGIRSLTTLSGVASFDKLAIGPGTITVTGSDKPRLDYINGSWYTWISDVCSNHIWGKNIEGFFQSADPTIFIKQCHDMKNYLTTHLPVINRKSVFEFQASNASQATRQTMNTLLGRKPAFNDSASSRKYSKRPAPGIGEVTNKAVFLYRTLQRTPGGIEFLKEWEKIKQRFNDETGYCPTIEVFGKFYNLDTGEISTVDELFPNGWHIND